MNDMINFWPLLGIIVITVAFIFRINPMLAVVVSAITTIFAAKITINDGLTIIGKGFMQTRNLSLLVFLPLAAVGLIERNGLREKSQALIANFKSITISKLLISYLGLRQLTAALGLNSLGGHPQMVRPILAPMLDKIISAHYPNLNEQQSERLRSLSAATDNVGLFFGEDVFVAFGAIALMANFMQNNNIKVEMLNIAMWSIPTAFCAFFIHSFILYRHEIHAYKINKTFKTDGELS